MPLRLPCPLPQYPNGWIEIPTAWLGSHAAKRDEILEKIQGWDETENGPKPKQTAVNWMVATALMDNWGGITPMEGSPDKWDFTKIPLELIAWITTAVNGSYWACWEIKKNSSGT